MTTIMQPAVLLCLLLVVDVSFGSIIAPIRFIGGRGGGYTSKQYTDGRTLKKLEVWAGGWQLRSVKFHWSNGHVDTIGKEKGKKEFKFTFNTGERLKSLWIWSSKGEHGKRCGAFKMITTSDREFFPKMTKKVKKKNRAEVDIGSGIIIGFEADHGSDVDRLGFRILRPVTHAVLKNVNYPDLNLNRVGLQPWNIDVIDYTNTGAHTQTQKLIGSREITTSSTWSVGTSLEYSTSVSVEAGVPKVASVGVKTTFTVGITATYSITTTTTNTRTYEFPVVVPPRTHTYATARLYHGPINTRYTGRMYVTLDNGQSFNYAVTGNYKGVTSTGAYVDLKEHCAHNKE
jgi:hypothetical protein